MRCGAHAGLLLGVALAIGQGDAGAQEASAPLDAKQVLASSQAAIGRRLSDHAFIDSEGRHLRLAQLRGKPLLISFIYTGCFRVCPTTTQTLRRAEQAAAAALGADKFNVLSIGFNQPFDTPEALAAFAAQQGVRQANWRFVSPDRTTLAALADEVGFTWAPLAGGFDHLIQITVVDGEGRIVAQVYGERFALPQLVEPLKAALIGAPVGGESLAGLIERVRILCTYYDPASGRYRYKTSILIELAGAATAIVLVSGFLLREARRRRMRAAALEGSALRSS